jgi:hypothetical protein
MGGVCLNRKIQYNRKNSVVSVWSANLNQSGMRTGSSNFSVARYTPAVQCGLVPNFLLRGTDHESKLNQGGEAGHRHSVARAFTSSKYLISSEHAALPREPVEQANFLRLG